MTRKNLRILTSAFCALCGMMFLCAESKPASAQKGVSVSASPAPLAPASAAPQVFVTLSSPTYIIRCDSKTGAPVMPKDVTATATVLNWPGGAALPTTFTWHVYLDWKMPGWEGFETRHPIDEKTFDAPSPFRPDLSGAIRGGTLTIYAKALCGEQPITGMARGSVVAFNPSRKMALAAFPVSRFGLIASKVGTAESGLRQFAATTPTSPGGHPLVSSSGDVGMMQLNAPTGAITSSDQVWDWRQNVRRGLEMLLGKGRTSVTVARNGMGSGWQRPSECGLQCLANLNAARLLIGLPPLPTPEAPPLSSAPNSGLLPGEEDPDHISLSQVERDAIRRYNGGREYAFTILPNADTLGIARACWEVDPTRGGVRASSGSPDYVARVLAARSGFVYPPPKPKPLKTKKGNRSRHNHKKRTKR